MWLLRSTYTYFDMIIMSPPDCILCLQNYKWYSCFSTKVKLTYKYNWKVMMYHTCIPTHVEGRPNASCIGSEAIFRLCCERIFLLVVLCCFTIWFTSLRLPTNFVAQCAKCIGGHFDDKSWTCFHDTIQYGSRAFDDILMTTLTRFHNMIQHG